MGNYSSSVNVIAWARSDVEIALALEKGVHRLQFNSKAQTYHNESACHCRTLKDMTG
jgi:hypothetical protein